MKIQYLLVFCLIRITPILSYQANEFKKLNIPAVSVARLLQSNGAKLHPNCLHDGVSVAVTHRGGSSFLGSLIKNLPKSNDSQESIIPSSDQVQEASLVGQDLLEQLIPLIVMMNNSQAYYLQDQQKTLQEIQQKPSIGGTELVKIGNQVNQIREQQKSWIPATTQQLIATTRSGAGSVITVVSIVGLLILAKYFGFL